MGAACGGEWTLQASLEFLDILKVIYHVGGQDEGSGDATKLAPHRPIPGRAKVTVGSSQDGKQYQAMIILHRAPIIIYTRKWVFRFDDEFVFEPEMANVVGQSGDEQRKVLQVGQLDVLRG